MTIASRPAPAGSPQGIGWRRAIGFALLVTAVATVASGLIAAAVTLVTPAAVWPILPSVVGGALLIAAVATPVHALLLVAVPPRTRWGVLRRAVVAAYIGVALGTSIALFVSAGEPALMFTLYALAIFTVSGAFLVPGAVAALCAPVLASGLRWRGVDGGASAPSGAPASGSESASTAEEAGGPAGLAAPPP